MNKQLSDKLREFDKVVHKKYARKSKRERKKNKRNWKTYEEEYMSHVKNAMQESEPLLKEASNIKRINKRGRRYNQDRYKCEKKTCEGDSCPGGAV